jgi:branched-chain amino acid transport system permease protein
MSAYRFVLTFLFVVAGLALWPLAYDQRYILHIGVICAIYTILALSMNLMLRTGLVSLGHAALMAIGAYASALATMRLGLPFVPALLGAGFLVALVAALVGPIFLRVRGVYFILLTFAFAQVVLLNFMEWVDPFGGNSGLSNIPPPSLFGIVIRTPLAFYWLALSVAALSFLAVRGIYLSTLGTMIDALREEERLASSLGLNAMGFQIVIFCISGFFAGLSGSLYAHYMTFISPDAFGTGVVTDIILINVFGGVTSPIGPVVGSLILVPLPELLREAQKYQVLAYGLLLIALQLFLPDGLVGFARSLRARLAGPA